MERGAGRSAIVRNPRGLRGLPVEGGAWQAKRGQRDAGRRYQLRGITGFPLVLSGFGGTRVLIELTYDRRRIADEAAGRMLRHLHTTLEGMIADPGRALGELPILTRGLKDGNSSSSGTRRPEPSRGTTPSRRCSRRRSNGRRRPRP